MIEVVRQCIRRHIESVEQLRILLLLRANPDKDWTPTDINRTLYLPLGVVETELARLATSGFLTVGEGLTPCYRYSPRTAELASLVDLLVEFDKERPVTLINLIYARNRLDRSD